MDAIKELNYIPNTVAKSLKTSQSRIIGILAEDVNAFSSGAIIDGICQYCEDHDYAVNLCNLRVNEKVDYTQSSMYTQLEISASFQSSVQKSLNLLTTSRVDGLVILVFIRGMWETFFLILTSPLSIPIPIRRKMIIV